MHPEWFLTSKFLAKALLFGAFLPFFVSAAALAEALERDAEAAAKPGDELALKLNLSGESFSIPQEHSLFFGPAFDLIYRHNFDEHFETHFDLGAEVYTGSNSGALPSDVLGQNGPRQNFRMHEATVEAHDADRRFDAQVGAVNQRFVNNPLLFGDFAFLAARQDVRVTDSVGHVNFGLEEGVPPSSFTLLESAATPKTPTFYLVHLDDEAGDLKSNYVQASVGYFVFNDLSAEQARQSLYIGNTVTGTDTDAQFYLPYRGFEGGIGGGFLFADRWQAVTQVNVLKNVAAPAGSNVGGLAKFGINYRAERHTIGGEGGYFYDQSDSSPAIFADASLNSKDHRGFYVGGRFTDEIKHYSVYAHWMHGDALVSNIYAGRDETIIVGLEIRYELLK